MPKKKSKAVDSSAQPATPGEAGQAFERVRAAIEAVADSELVAINVDVPRAVSTVLGALQSTEALLPELGKLPQLDHTELGKLRDYAFAAWFAHLTASSAISESEKEALLAEAGPLRAELLVAAEALAYKGAVDQAAVATIRAGAGNLDRANDLVALAALFTGAWDRVHNKTMVTWQEVEKAAELGSRLFMALSAAPVDGPEAEDLRSRAFTLLARTYEQLRRGVTFLRWDEEDADQLAPSIYAGRKRRRASADKPDAETDAKPPTPPEAQPSAS